MAKNRRNRNRNRGGNSGVASITTIAAAAAGPTTARPPVMARVSGWYAADAGGRRGESEGQALSVSSTEHAIAITMSRVTCGGKTEHRRMDLSLADALRLADTIAAEHKARRIAAAAAVNKEGR